MQAGRPGVIARRAVRKHSGGREESPDTTGQHAARKRRRLLA